MFLSKVSFRYIFVFIFFSVAIASCYMLYTIEDANDLIIFITTVAGLVVSSSAFIVAMSTYLSIDSVNVISQMEGNVLENENYITSFTSLIKEYDMKDSKTAGDKIFTNLEERFTKNSKTAMDFATNLQYFIDLIVIMPYLFNPEDEQREQHINRMSKLLRKIDKRKQALLAIGTGNLILIEETVQLIKSIVNYQKLIDTNDLLTNSTLLEVRGTLLKNAVTQTVYYNYLGLYYNKKAFHVLLKQFNVNQLDFFSLDGLSELKKRLPLLSSEATELVTIYLTEAKICFDKALQHGENDLMWEGFIKYNLARTTYLLQLLLPAHEESEWQKMMNEALIARRRLTILINDTLPNEETSHLQEAFRFEYLLASLININIAITEKKDVTDSFGRPKYKFPHYDGLKEDFFITPPYNGPFNKIIDYQRRILVLWTQDQ